MFYNLKLFDRIGGKIKLTDCGVDFFNVAYNIWDNFENSVRFAEDLNASTTRLVIGGVLNTDVFAACVTEACELMRQNFPEFYLRLSSHSSSSQKEQAMLLRAGEISGSTLFFSQGLEKEGDLVVRRVWDIPAEAIVSSSCPLSRKDLLRLADLDGYKQIQLISPLFTPIWKCIKNQLDRTGVSYTVAPLSTETPYDLRSALNNLSDDDVFVTYNGMYCGNEDFGLLFENIPNNAKAIPIENSEFSFGFDFVFLRKNDSRLIECFIDSLQSALSHHFPRI